MRFWLTIFALTTTITLSSAQTPLTINWLSFLRNNSGTPVPIRINPANGAVDLTNGVFVDSRFPSVKADGSLAIFQIGTGATAQIWQAILDLNTNQWQISFVPIPGTDPPVPLQGLHPIVSADGNYVAFASTRDYGAGSNGRQQIYVFDRQQNRIVPISLLWRDNTGSDGIRDEYELSNGNCIPVYISANGRIVVFLAESPNGLNVV
ncbi:MAG: hypothetical protein NZ805_14285, partial [Armatimonadetes bacterium]|nr:hypothetical protein [Armatimonadota bacterium]